MESVLPSQCAHEADPSECDSLGVFNELIAEGGGARLCLDTSAEHSGCDAVLVSAAPAHLTFELATSDARRCGVQTSALMCVVFKIREVRSTFTAPCLCVEFGAESTVIRIETPHAVAKAERRRSPRRGLHEPVRVLIWVGAAKEPLAEAASLMNLSTDGLACRLTASAAAISIHDVVRVSFQLDHTDARFEFSACVINVTQGATVDKTILGLEFVAEEMLPAEKDRLVAALAATGPR